MAWETLPTYSPNDVATEAELLKFYNNLEVLRQGNSQTKTLWPSTTNLSKSGATWADISSDLNITMETYGGNALLIFNSNMEGGTATDAGLVDFAVDGTLLHGGGTGPIYIYTALRRIVSFIYPVIGLSAGVHTFNPQWYAISGSLVLRRTQFTTFAVREY